MTVVNKQKLNEQLRRVCLKGEVKKAQYLLRLGASVYVIKDMVNYILQDGSEDMLKFCFDKIVDVNEKDKVWGGAKPIEKAIRFGNLNAVKVLLERGVELEEKNKYGSTPLLLALLEGRKEIMEYLVEKGANVNACNRYGESALHIALYKKDKEIVKWLLDKGADVEGRSEFYITPLMYAIDKDNDEIVRLLIERGADVNGVDLSGFSVLHRIANRGSLKLFLEVEKMGADVNCVDKRGNNMLMWAADGNNFEVAKELVERGMDVNKVGQFGQTPFIRACYKKNFKIAKLMAENGADISVRDTHYDKTGLEYLTEEQRIEILKLMGKWEGKLVVDDEKKDEKSAQNQDIKWRAVARDVEEVDNKQVEMKKESNVFQSEECYVENVSVKNRKVKDVERSFWARIKGILGR